MTLRGAFSLAGLLLLGACASPPPDDFFQDFSLRTSDGDSVGMKRLRSQVTVFVFIDPLCPMVQDAAQHGGMFQELEQRLREDGAELVLVGVSSAQEALSAGDFRAWQKDVNLQGRFVLDSAGDLARREHVKRVPWAVVVDAKGVRRYRGPAESMKRDTADFLLVDAAERAMFGEKTKAGREEGDGCRLKFR